MSESHKDKKPDYSEFRDPIEFGNALDAEKIPGYVLYWGLTSEFRKLVRQGYSPVESKDVACKYALPDDQIEQKNDYVTLDSGPDTLVLMKIPEELHADRQKRRKEMRKEELKGLHDSVYAEESCPVSKKLGGGTKITHEK